MEDYVIHSPLKNAFGDTTYEMKINKSNELSDKMNQTPENEQSKSHRVDSFIFVFRPILKNTNLFSFEKINFNLQSKRDFLFY